jgi:hypothetical protein
MDRAGVRVLAMIASLAMACGDDVVEQPDASTDDGGVDIDTDAGENVSALEIEWRTSPKLDDDPKGAWELVLTHAKFSLEDVRVVGDAATLMKSSLELDFKGEERPVLRFSSAPPGLYASLIGRIKSYELRGTIVVDSETVEFEIKDEPPGALSFQVQLQGVEVVPGETERVRIDIEVDDVIEEIDWTMVGEVDGVLTIDGDSAEVEAVRDELAEQFDFN